MIKKQIGSLKTSVVYNFFDTLLLTLLIFSGGSLLFVFHRNLFSVILLLVALFSILFLGQQIKKSVFNASFFTLILFSSLILLNYILANPDHKFLKYGFHLMNLTSCILILVHFKNNRTSKYFLSKVRHILRVVLYFSIFNFLAYFFIKDSLFPSYGGWNNEYVVDTFKYVFFYNLEKPTFNFFGIELVRNQGWFWEPGVNQVYLNILLYLEGFVFKRGKWIIPLIILAIVTTYSTTGIFIMMIVLIPLFIKFIKRNPLLYIILGLLIIYPLFRIAQTNFEDKSSDNVSSMNKRIFDLVQPLMIALDHPFTGVGLDIEQFQKYRSEYFLDDDTQSLLAVQNTQKGSTNSVTFLVAATGFPISLFLIYCLFKQNLFTHRKEVFMSIIFISVLSEPLLLRPFFLILIVSGMFLFLSRFTNHRKKMA